VIIESLDDMKQPKVLVVEEHVSNSLWLLLHVIGVSVFRRALFRSWLSPTSAHCKVFCIIVVVQLAEGVNVLIAYISPLTKLTV